MNFRAWKGCDACGGCGDDAELKPKYKFSCVPCKGTGSIPFDLAAALAKARAEGRREMRAEALAIAYDLYAIGYDCAPVMVKKIRALGARAKHTGDTP